MNYGDKVVVESNGGDNFIENYSTKVTILGDSGNDTIINKATAEKNSLKERPIMLL